MNKYITLSIAVLLALSGCKSSDNSAESSNKNTSNDTTQARPNLVLEYLASAESFL